MKKIFKILIILEMTFVFFSCANSASDDSNPTSEPSKHSWSEKEFERTNKKVEWGFKRMDYG